MLKFLSFFRFIINPIFQCKLFNNKKTISFIKKIYSFFFTRKGVKNMSRYVSEIDTKIRDILIKYNGYMGCGNCLFLARGQDSFGKNDIDYCVQDVNNENINEFIKECQSLGFKHAATLYHNEQPIELKFNYKKTYFDVFLLEKINEKYVLSKTILMNDNFPVIIKINKKIFLDKCCVVEQKWSYIKFTIEKEMNGHKYLIPKNYEEYLTLQYGYNWTTPIKNFDFLTKPLNNPPILYEIEGRIEYE